MQLIKNSDNHFISEDPLPATNPEPGIRVQSYPSCTFSDPVREFLTGEVIEEEMADRSKRDYISSLRSLAEKAGLDIPEEPSKLWTFPFEEEMCSDARWQCEIAPRSFAMSEYDARQYTEKRDFEFLKFAFVPLDDIPYEANVSQYVREGFPSYKECATTDFGRLLIIIRYNDALLRKNYHGVKMYHPPFGNVLTNNSSQKLYTPFLKNEYFTDAMAPYASMRTKMLAVFIIPQ